MMSRLMLLPLLSLALTSAACAETPKTCIDPSRSYEAHAIDAHNLRAKATIGPDRTELQFTTTCIDLKQAYRFSLSSNFHCVTLGDTVVATAADGTREACRITRIALYAPSK